MLGITYDQLHMSKAFIQEKSIMQRKLPTIEIRIMGEEITLIGRTCFYQMAIHIRPVRANDFKHEPLI